CLSDWSSDVCSSDLYEEGTPDPDDVNADNTFKSTLRDLLDTAGFELSTDPDDLAVTIRKVDTKDTSDTDDDTGVEWSVTDRKSRSEERRVGKRVHSG